MAFEILWLEEVEYSARLDRYLIDVLLTEGMVGSGFGVSQRAAGANTSVDVAAGYAVVTGDDETRQGKYLLRNTATYNLVMPARPAAGNNRIDLVIAQVRDSQAGGAAGDDFTITYVTGTPVANPGVSVAPAVPDSAVILAEVDRTGSESSIATAAIRAGSRGGLASIFGDYTVNFRDDVSITESGVTLDLDPADFLGRILLDTESDYARFRGYHQDTPAVDEVITRFEGYAQDAAAATTLFADWRIAAGATTAGAVDGILRGHVAVAGAMTEKIRIEKNGVRIFTALLDSTGAKIFGWGAGSPESAFTAPKGCLYVDQTNGNAYVKRSGTSNTGWVRIDASRSSYYAGSGIISGLTTNTQLYKQVQAAASNAFVQLPNTMDRAGSIVGISVQATSARTAGSVVCEVYKNGSGTGLTVTLDGTHTQYFYATQAAGLDTFVAGDRLDVRATVSSFTPNTAYIECTFLVEFSD